MKVSYAVLGLCLAQCVHSLGLFDTIIETPGNIVREGTGLLDGIFGGRKTKTDSCDRDVSQEYKKAVTAFNNKLYTHIAARSDNHFVFSPYTIWLSLSALAEGADQSVQSQIFSSLNFPQESCIRYKYYDIAMNVVKSGRDVSLKQRRRLILDEGLKVNSAWGKMMQNTGHIKYGYAPIKKDPVATSKLVRNYISTRSNIVVKGNSVLLESLDYEGLWTTAFPEASIQSQPFFNELGQKIGTVDMMHMRKKVRLARVPFLSAQVVELPVGIDGRYTMLIAVGNGNSILKNAIDVFMGSITEIFSLLQISLFPLDIAIPKFAVTSEFDARPALEEIGIISFWKDPAATRYVSNPPATPGGLIQRVSMKVDSKGLEPPPTASEGLISGLVDLAENTVTGVAKVAGREFVADRPFMFALFDTQTRTCILSGAFSRPNTLR